MPLIVTETVFTGDVTDVVAEAGNGVPPTRRRASKPPVTNKRCTRPTVTALTIPVPTPRRRDWSSVLLCGLGSTHRATRQPEARERIVSLNIVIIGVSNWVVFASTTHGFVSMHAELTTSRNQVLLRWLTPYSDRPHKKLTRLRVSDLDSESEAAESH